MARSLEQTDDNNQESGQGKLRELLPVYFSEVKYFGFLDFQFSSNKFPFLPAIIIIDRLMDEFPKEEEESEEERKEEDDEDEDEEVSGMVPHKFEDKGTKDPEAKSDTNDIRATNKEMTSSSYKHTHTANRAQSCVNSSGPNDTKTMRGNQSKQKQKQKLNSSKVPVKRRV